MADPAPPPIALSFDEAANAIGISKRTLQALVKKGAGPPILRIGVRVLFPVQDLAEWINSHVGQTIRTQ